MTVTLITVNGRVHKCFMNSKDALDYFNEYVKVNKPLELNVNESARFSDGRMMRIETIIPE